MTIFPRILIIAGALFSPSGVSHATSYAVDCREEPNHFACRKLRQDPRPPAQMAPISGSWDWDYFWDNGRQLWVFKVVSTVNRPLECYVSYSGTLTGIVGELNPDYTRGGDIVHKTGRIYVPAYSGGPPRHAFGTASRIGSVRASMTCTPK